MTYRMAKKGCNSYFVVANHTELPDMELILSRVSLLNNWRDGYTSYIDFL